MKYRELFRIEQLPVFQNKMFETREAALACPKGDIVLVEDRETGLIFNSAFDPSLLVYDKSYQNEQACSHVFQQHLSDVEQILHPHFQGKALIEVGCGKGYFLQHLEKDGYDITGVDPAYEGCNPKIIKATFDAGLGLSADGIVLRHVLEHIADPVNFLSSLAHANNGKGMIYIEVPCLDWICEHHAWFDVFYEHVNYFRLADFHRMFARLNESGHVFGGQYLYVVAELSSLRRPKLAKLEREEGLIFPADFLFDVEQARNLAESRRSAIWGGASKGVIFSLYLQRAGGNIDMVIDINPAKQNKFIPGTGHRVVSPGEAMQTLKRGDVIFVMNSNYLQEIIELSMNQFHYIRVDLHEF